jgi:hypothetical protein
LKSKNLAGIKFRRQEPVGDYIVDFVAFENRLVIEVDAANTPKMRKTKTFCGMHGSAVKDSRSYDFGTMRFCRIWRECWKPSDSTAYATLP